MKTVPVYLNETLDPTLEAAKQKARSTYNAASDTFDDPANAYWDRYGRRTVERLNLSPGASVLDVACGTGASAIPAAKIVVPTGSVIGIDLAEKMLTRARAKAEAFGLSNIDFRQADMTQLGFADNSFDAVVCVFGIFFVPDMESLTAELLRMVKPGGKLAITTWGPDFFEPVYSVFKNFIGEKRPDLVTHFRPWDRTTSVSGVEQLLYDGGARNIMVQAELGEQPFLDSDSWWKMVMGSGLRGTVEALGPQLASRLRQANNTYIKENNIRSVKTNVIYGVAKKED